MVQDTRRINREAVLTQLLLTGPSSRKKLAVDADVSPATVSRAIDDLLREGIVTEGEPVATEGRGRRAVLIELNGVHTGVVGVDLGASLTRVIVSDLLARPVAALETATPTTGSPVELAAWLDATIRATAGEWWPKTKAVAVGVPGSVNQLDGTIANAPNLPQVAGASFRTTLARLLSLPLLTDNDANYALLGEQRFGAARASPDAAMVTLGAGLGAAIAVDGAILRGRTGMIGEFSYLPMAGTRVEELVTGTGMMRRARAAGIRLDDPREIFSGAPDVSILREDFDRALLTVLVAISVAGEPSVLVLGGGVARSLKALLDGYQGALDDTLPRAPRLAFAELDDFSGATGAVVAALHRLYAAMGVGAGAFAELPRADVRDLMVAIASEWDRGERTTTSN